jgi:hypothetical protein
VPRAGEGPGSVRRRAALELAPLRARRHRAWRDVTAATAVVLALFAVAGALATWWVSGEPGAVRTRLLRPRLPLTLALFAPWARVQQALLQSSTC